MLVEPLPGSVIKLTVRLRGEHYAAPAEPCGHVYGLADHVVAAQLRRPEFAAHHGAEVHLDIQMGDKTPFAGQPADGGAEFAQGVHAARHARRRDHAQALGAVQLHQAGTGTGYGVAGKDVVGLQKLGDAQIFAGRMPLSKTAEAKESDPQFHGLPRNGRCACGRGLDFADPAGGQIGHDALLVRRILTTNLDRPRQPTRVALNLRLPDLSQNQVTLLAADHRPTRRRA